LVWALPHSNRMTLTRLILSVVVVSLLPATAAVAKPKHWHEDKKYRGQRWDDDRGDRRRGADCYFEGQDVRIIREYYEPRARSLPPGLAKKYRRTGHLPPGWAKRMEPLPVAVERRLVVLPPDYRRGYIDGSVVVYSPRTQMVIDVVAVF